MNPKREALPSDQFERTKAEFLRLDSMLNEIDRAIETADAVRSFEAHRFLEKARDEFMVAALWLNKAIKALDLIK